MATSNNPIITLPSRVTNNVSAIAGFEMDWAAASNVECISVLRWNTTRAGVERLIDMIYTFDISSDDPSNGPTM
jgi:hypothetical protein